MSRVTDIEGAMRSLDAADHRTDSGSARAVTDLQLILATDPSPAPLHPPRTAGPEGRQAKGRRTAPKAALAGAMLVAVTAAVFLLPSLSGGDAAFASWTPNPDAISATDRPEAAANCREAQGGAGHDYAAQLSTAKTVIAERRGVWTTVLLAGQDGFNVLCITDESSPFYSKGMIGHIGTPTDWTPPGPRGLTAASLGSGTVDSAALSLAAGAAGADIIKIVYRSPAYGDVTATLSDGHFALWLPGTELGNASNNGVELEVTYRDSNTATTTLTL